jgi:hypothetical protein
VDQKEGPLELVHLASGLRVLELPAGPRAVTLAVPPGKYLVRKVAQAGISAREISVPRDGSARLEEGELVLVGSERLAVKGGEPRDGAAVPARMSGDLEIGVEATDAPEYSNGTIIGAGVGRAGYTTLRLDARLGITDRLTWKVGTLGLAYGLGNVRRWELVPYGGIIGWTADVGTGSGGATTILGAGLGGRLRLGPVAFVATVHWENALSGPEADAQLERAALGMSVDFWHVVTLHVAAGIQARTSPVGAGSRGGWIVGSIQELGLATLPLLAIHAPRGWSLDLYGNVFTDGWNRTEGKWRVGVAKAF